MVFGTSEKEYCTQSCHHGIRLDGRACEDFRPFELELGLIAQASGSARLHLGGTDVIVGVKVCARVCFCVCLCVCVCVCVCVCLRA